MSATPAIPPSLHALMAEIGPRWGTSVTQHVKQMVDEFSRVLADQPTDGIRVTRNLAYGAHPRQVLDVYRPAATAGTSEATGPLPVLIFAHGGAFIDGEKDRTPQVYSNVLYYFARNGVLGINMEYRQAPEFKYPSGAQDVGGAVAWARAHAAEYGGDPTRIFIMGHSAGAAHTGCYAYDASLHPEGGPGIAGHIVLSGRVRTEMRADNPNAKKVEAYCGSDPAMLEKASAVTHVTAQSVPTFVGFAEYENPLIDLHCSELVFRIAAAKGRAPRLMRLPGHNHTSIIAHFNTAEEALGREILEFIRTGK